MSLWAKNKAETGICERAHLFNLVADVTRVARPFRHQAPAGAQGMMLPAAEERHLEDVCTRWVLSGTRLVCLSWSQRLSP